MSASPAMKRKRDASPQGVQGEGVQPVQLPYQLPIHSASTSSRFTFIAPMPARTGADEVGAVAVATATTDNEPDPGAGSPRSHVATHFGSLVIHDEEEKDEEERVHKRMRADVPPEKEKQKQNEKKPPIDPLRASLTWQDDEITVYDPNDADDDGTGVNGIGFKPTPAIAHARALKRRQQLADYRKREEREARARRSRRRRPPRVYGQVVGAAEEPVEAEAAESTQAEPAEPLDVDTPEATPRPRRVHFLETEPVTIRFLEPEVTV